MALLINTLCVLSLVNYVFSGRNTSSIPKNTEEEFSRGNNRRPWFGDGTIEEQRKYEKIQHSDYLRNKEYYQKWDDVSADDLEKLCQHYVFKLFTMTTDRKVIPSLLPGLLILRYQLIKQKNNAPIEPAHVTVLQCFYNKSGHKSHFHYIKSPKSHCVYMVKPISRNWSHPGVPNDMRIVNEFCNRIGKRKQNENTEGTNKELAVELKYAIGRGQLTRSGETSPIKRCKYEKDHYMEYKLYKDKYMMWPELNAVSNKVSFCRKFIMKIYGNGPRFQTLEIIPKVRRMETLVYIDTGKISDDDESRSAIVSLLECIAPKSKNQRHFYFIRSSKPNCVLLVKHVSWNTPWKFGIINRLCDGDSPEEEHT